MSYQIITDSCCDFTKADYAALDITVAPLTLLYKGESYDSFTEEEELHAFYDGVRGGEMPSTSAVNPDGWSRIMEPALKAGKDVLCLAFSSGLSTTYQSAVIAAEELRETYPDRKIIVIDTLCAALGQGLLVMHACKHRDAGMSLDELTQWVEENKLNLCQWFTVDDLMYLKRGGRVSAATALVGTMLKIKPVLHVDEEGHLINVAKVRGRKASIEALADKVAQLGLAGKNDLMAICHGDCIDDAKYLERLLKERFGTKEVFIGYTGAVIGSHSGPGTLAVFFLGSNR